MSSQHSSAALTGALLASKGAAAPSNSVSAFLEEQPTSQESSRKSVAAAPSQVRLQMADTVTSSQGSEASSSEIAAARAKLSVRLDPDRHLRLKLAAAHLRRSSQAIMLDALDAYLSSVTPALDPACPCLNDDA